MPTYQFTGSVPEAPDEDTLWQPDEERPVTDAQAALLDRNAQWRRVPEPVVAPASEAAEALAAQIAVDQAQLAALAAQPDATTAPDAPQGG